MFALGDIVSAVTPIGLFFGRVANFINGELFGRVSDVPWAMVFPHGGPEPRHPSQLYQATLEGIVLFIVLAVLAQRIELRRRPGFIGGAFLCGYAIARMTGELFREPDAQLGFIIGPVTMGQLLSLPMLLVGIWLMVSSGKREKLPLTKRGA
jgi:phosphatidylglycerol:prolipoprotein diacylglycerol transferase